MRYLVRINSAVCRFEEMSAEAFELRGSAINTDGSLKFQKEQWCSITPNGQIKEIHVSNMTTSELGLLMRAIGVVVPTGAVQGGFVQAATTLRCSQRGTIKLVTPDGQVFKQVAKKAA